MNSDSKKKSPSLYIPIAIIWACSGVLAGISFYAMSRSVGVPDFQANNPSDTMAVALSGAFASFENVFNFLMPFMAAVLGLLTIGLLVSSFMLWVVLYFWNQDKKKMIVWQEVGFACERLEFLEGNRVRMNHTELILNKSQYLTMQKLVSSRMEGEALHGIELGENATQVIKRLREELGSKLLEKTLIMNHRGKGYWFDIDPKKIKGLILT